MDVHVDVVVADERRVRGEPVVLFDHQGVARQVETGHVPVGVEVVELEIGRAELVDVAGDDEVRHGLSLVLAGRAHRRHGRN